MLLRWQESRRGQQHGGGGVSRPPKAVSDYMASLGRKGGTAKGKRKARAPEHYQKMVEARRAKREKQK